MRVVRSIENAARLCVDLAIAAFFVGLAVIGLDGIWDPPLVALKRKCLKCGGVYAGSRECRAPLDRCARCGYCLQGNVSGVCPECGWKLPRRYRRFAAQASHLRASPRRPKSDEAS